MAEKERTSDWETLIQKCLADSEYRGKLSTALKDNKPDVAAKLLKDIGVAGRDQSELDARIRALKAARDPVSALETAFGFTRVPLV